MLTAEAQGRGTRRRVCPCSCSWRSWSPCPTLTEPGSCIGARRREWARVWGRGSGREYGAEA
eukprot:752839-Hanusia_phi.AAC.1